jgi:hypothetical protein
MNLNGRLKRLEEAAEGIPCPVCAPRKIEFIETVSDPANPPPAPPLTPPPRCPGCGRPWSGPPIRVIEIMLPTTYLQEAEPTDRRQAP